MSNVVRRARWRPLLIEPWAVPYVQHHLSPLAARSRFKQRMRTACLAQGQHRFNPRREL